MPNWPAANVMLRSLNYGALKADPAEVAMRKAVCRIQQGWCRSNLYFISCFLYYMYRRVETAPLSPVPPADGVCILMAPLLIEREISSQHPPTPDEPEPPIIDTTLPKVAPLPPLKLKTPPLIEVEAPADRLLAPTVAALRSPAST